MSWEWSHTSEAYHNAKTNLQSLAKANLEIIYAEWKAYPADARNSSSANLNMEIYERELERAKALNRDQLVGYIWPLTEQLATCTNGGHLAWCCPFGCQCHMVSFSTKA